MKKTVVAGSLVLDILPVFPHAVTSDMLLAEGKVTECQEMCIRDSRRKGIIFWSLLL